MHLIIIKNQEETSSGKVVFERWADRFGVKIIRYHTDNGRFSEKLFRSAIEDSNQTITFCGVVSHHQHVIVERKILTVILGAKALLIHENIYLSEAINTMLWTYVPKAFSEQLNEINVDNYGITPMEKFSGTTTDIPLKNHHTWGWPVYVLDERL